MPENFGLGEGKNHQYRVERREVCRSYTHANRRERSCLIRASHPPSFAPRGFASIHTSSIHGQAESSGAHGLVVRQTIDAAGCFARMALICPDANTMSPKAPCLIMRRDSALIGLQAQYFPIKLDGFAFHHIGGEVFAD